jgi:ABC-2 type transport system permease protein
VSGVWLVVERELREALRRRSFWIVAGIALLGSSAAMILPEVLDDDDGPERHDVALVGAAPAISAGLHDAADALGIEIVIDELPDAASAEAAVDEGTADVAAVLDGEPVIIVQAGEQQRLVAIVRQTVRDESLTRRLVEAGVPDEEVGAVLAGSEAGIVELDVDEDGRRGSAALVATVLYLLLIMLMVQVANGTAIEKSNRISEVLLAIVRPGALLFGKVIGIGIIGVITLACAVAPVAVKLGAGGDLPDGIGGVLVSGVAWFVLGVALYLVLAGALGALVERQEEAGTVTSPLSVLLIGAFIVGQNAADTPLGAVLAILPLTSPLVMPARIAIGEATGSEIALSLVLGVLAVALVARFGVVVYRRAIVRTGHRLKLREVL